MRKELSVRTTTREEMHEITAAVEATVRAAGILTGTCTIFIPHTTCAVTINENADPSVRHDILAALAALVPHRCSIYEHGEGNSDAHIKTALVGSSVSVPIKDGAIDLGTWQGIFLCEFDGPRTRRVVITIAES